MSARLTFVKANQQMTGCFSMPVFSGMLKVTDTVRLRERLQFIFVK